MIQSEQQERILERLRRNGGSCDIEELTELLSASRVTVHRILNKMQEANLVQKERGGVRITEQVNQGYSDDLYKNSHFYQRQTINATLKRELATKAFDLLKEGDTVFLDSSSTVYVLVEEMADRFTAPITIVTNSPAIVWRLAEQQNFHVIFVGGELDHMLMACVGTLTTDTIASLSFNKAVISPAAVSSHGLLTSQSSTVSILRQVFRKDTQIILLAETPKVDRVAPLLIAPLDDIACFVTDSMLSDERRLQFEQQGLYIL